jgi:hypothetical protein
MICELTLSVVTLYQWLTSIMMWHTFFHLLLQAQVQKMKKENVKKKMRKGIEG